MMFTFGEKRQKRRYRERQSRNGFTFRQSSTGTNKISSDEILESLQWLFDANGRIVIEWIDEDEINVTTLDSARDTELENSLEEMKEIIKAAIKQNKH